MVVRRDNRERRCEAVLIARFFLMSLALWTGVSSGSASPGEGASLGLPKGRTEGEAPAKVALGARIFRDTRLSRDGTISCATCHKPDHAFTDGRRVAEGLDAQRGTRNTPTLLNVAYNITEFWDGRRESLEAQALDPLTNPLEHGLADNATLIDRIRTDPQYVKGFQVAFGSGNDAVTSAHVAEAVASYERTLIAGGSAFDRYFYGNDKTALDVSAQRGLALFRGSAQCSGCHTIGTKSALFTDNGFHRVSIGRSRIASKLAELTIRVVAARKDSKLSVGDLILSDPEISDLGRFVVTLDPRDVGKFRTPSLRNVALTAPYMHDGSVATLSEVVELELYNHVGSSARPLVLAPLEKRDLVDFLKTLRGGLTRSRVESHCHVSGRLVFALG